MPSINRKQVSRVLVGFVLTGVTVLAALLIHDLPASAVGVSGYPGPDGADQVKHEEDYPTSTVGSPEELCAAAFPFRTRLPEGTEKRDAEETSYALCVEARQSELPTPFREPLYGITPVAAEEADNMAARAAGDGRLIENGATVLPAQTYTIINSWSLQMADRDIFVQAGGVHAVEGQGDDADTVRGVVVVFVYSADRSQSIPEESGEFQLSENTGPLRIVDATGVVLTLLAKDGTVATFDVASRALLVAGDQAAPQREADNGVIVESSATVYGLDAYVFSNQWYLDDGQNRTTVLAGVETQDPWQSVLVVVTAGSTNPDTALAIQAYTAPVAAGQLRIMDVADDQVRLAESAGGLFVFDLGALEYVAWPSAE